jgi:hypothetical protein
MICDTKGTVNVKYLRIDIALKRGFSFRGLAEISGETFYRLNDDKLLEWLKRKVDSVCEYLETMPDAVGLIRAQVVGYKITEEDKLNDDQLIHLAIGFLKEYVPSNWINALKNAYGLDTAAIEAVYFEDVSGRGKKRKADDLEDDLDDAKTPAVRAFLFHRVLFTASDSCPALPWCYSFSCRKSLRNLSHKQSWIKLTRAE